MPTARTDRIIRPWATVLTQCHTVQAKSLTRSPRTHTTTSYPLHVLSSPPLTPTPFQQQRVAFVPVPQFAPHLRCAIKPRQPHFDRMRIRIMTSGTRSLALLPEFFETRPPVPKGLCECLVNTILPQKRREPTISAPVASCSVCHVDSRL